MDYHGDGEKGTNVECDRLSGLPDDLIYRILFLVGMKHAVQMSLLSSRWRLFWTSMPYLNFSSKEFSEGYKFSNFVTNVLSRRNNQLKTSSVNLTFEGTELSLINCDGELLIFAPNQLTPPKNKSNHALQLVFTDGMSPSFKKADLYIRNPRGQIDHKIFGQLQKLHNVQQMTITCLNGSYRWDSVFSSRWKSLKHLTLVGNMKSDYVILPSVWDLPVLTTLDLQTVRLAGESTTSGGFFSKCANLKSLTISNFDMADETNNVTICHSQLSNITLEDGTWRSEYLCVVTPQLKNLTVINCDGELLISAPDQLATLIYKSNYTLQLVFTDGELPSLEKVDLYIRNPHIRIAQRIFGLLQEFYNVRNLTLNLEIMEVFNWSPLFAFPHFFVYIYSIS
uniref:F-box/LRR-repeat protein At1g55660-like n=1 Tax=Erigeron canadensis TaxID=72917 RepID=UPI001CB9B6DB|nr:F-box/LRR-repeat protein At1g55660-like [Erigeron canadensis]